MIFAVYRSRHALNSFNCSVSSLLHSLAENDRVSACCQVLHTFVDHCLSENCCCRGAITCDIICFLCYLFDELCAHVLESIFEIDLFGDRDTIVRDGRCAVALVEYYVAALGSKCDLYCISKFVHTCCKSSPCVFAML